MANVVQSYISYYAGYKMTINDSLTEKTGDVNTT